ncbi:MAG: 6-phosphogluconolactonase [Phycisphaeraceae bacterium]
MLKLPGHVHTAPDAEQLFDDLGSALLGSAQRAIQERGVFHMALSGGGTPEPFYIRLVTDPKFRMFLWPQTHVWIVDERCVPEDHDKSNIKMIREAMIDHVPIKRSAVHPMPVMEPNPAQVYEEELSAAFNGLKLPAVPRLDFILLGMGGDAHTASLFPASPALDVTDRWIVGNDGERVVPPPRLTMTYPLINHGREVVVLLTGAGKHATLKKIEQQLTDAGPDVYEMPITGINPAANDGELTWYLDKAAATGK